MSGVDVREQVAFGGLGAGEREREGIGDLAGDVAFHLLDAACVEQPFRAKEGAELIDRTVLLPAPPLGFVAIAGVAVVTMATVAAEPVHLRFDERWAVAGASSRGRLPHRIVNG